MSPDRLNEADYQLERLRDLTASGTLVGIQQANVSTVIIMTYSDGSVESRDRSSLEILPRDRADRISSLEQIGFEIQERKPCR